MYWLHSQFIPVAMQAGEAMHYCSYWPVIHSTHVATDQCGKLQGYLSYEVEVCSVGRQARELVDQCLVLVVSSYAGQYTAGLSQASFAFDDTAYHMQLVRRQCVFIGLLPIEDGL